MEHREAELDWDGGWQAGLDGDELSELFLRGATTLPRGQLVGLQHHFGVLAGSEETQRYKARRAAAAGEAAVSASAEAPVAPVARVGRRDAEAEVQAA